MSAGFDNVGFVGRLEQADVDRKVAEAQADVVRAFILNDVATKRDLDCLQPRR